MAEGRTRERWNHTAAVLAMIANVNRDPKKGRPLNPADFHPMQEAQVSAPLRPNVSVSLLKTIFVENRPCSAASSS
jgi:hypothetical protein